MIFRSYTNDFHLQNSMGDVKEVESMLLHPCSREQKLAQINSLRQKAVSKTSQNSEQEELVS